MQETQLFQADGDHTKEIDELCMEFQRVFGRSAESDGLQSCSVERDGNTHLIFHNASLDVLSFFTQSRVWEEVAL